MVIYGSRLYGKVDVVPGLGHVATKFFHIDYVPLVPTETWLVTQQSGKSWRGVKVGLSAKSVFVAWARAVALLVGVVTPVIGVAAVVGPHPDATAAVVAGVVTALAWGIFAVTKTHKLFNRASYARACQLAAAVRMDNAGLAALAAAYGEAPPTFGFQPVMPAAAAPVPGPVSVVPVSVVEDEPPLPVTPATPLRGY